MQDDSGKRQVALRIADAASPQEGEAMRAWLGELLAIRQESGSSPHKALKAIAATGRHRVIWPLVKRLAAEIKRHGWDNRTKTAKFALSGAAVGLAFFGGQTAGLAALGTAIAVPIWVVLGAGAAFARVLYDELEHKRPVVKDATTGEVIKAVKGHDGVHNA
jgi:hypothetical protein